MGANREKKLREQAREAREETQRQTDLCDRTIQMLALNWSALKQKNQEIKWYESCVEEFQRLFNLGLIKIF